MTDERADGSGRRPWRFGENSSQWMRYLLLLLAVGVVLMSINNRTVRDVDTDAPAAAAEPPPSGTARRHDEYSRYLEDLVKDALMQLHGVQRVHVAVTLAGGPRKVLAETVTTERRTNEGPGGGDAGSWVSDERRSSQPVLVRSDQTRQESPVVLVEYLPAIEGVVVVTDAASDSRLRLEIARAVATLLGVASHRVYVLPQQFHDAMF